MTTTADMARQQVAEGEAVLVAEFAKSLDAQLEAALAEGRHCDEQLRDVGARLVEARGQAGPLWEKRTAVDLAMRELDKGLEVSRTQINYADSLPEEEYERKREELSEQREALLAEILPLSSLIGSLEDQYRGWKVAGHRARLAIQQVRVALAGGLQGPA